jgi:hypothetical protein
VEVKHLCMLYSCHSKYKSKKQACHKEGRIEAEAPSKLKQNIYCNSHAMGGPPMSPDDIMVSMKNAKHECASQAHQAFLAVLGLNPGSALGVIFRLHYR